MPEPIRVAVVGTGFGARIQVPGFRASGRFEVVALVGRDRAKTRAAATRLGVEHACSSVEEALRVPGLEAISIATPPAAHAGAAVTTARAGMHVLCEKPMARTVAEAELMAAAVSAAGVVGLIDHQLRFDPARATLARLIAGGELGVPRVATVIAHMPHFIDPWRRPPAWWFDADAGGGWLGACGSHALDALRVWLGPFAAVAAQVDAFARLPEAVAAPADDTYSIAFRMRSGAQGIVQQSAATWGPRFEALRVAGSEATAWIDGDGVLWRAGPRTEPEPVAIPNDLRLPAVALPPGAGPFAIRELPAFVRQVDRFAALVRGTHDTADPAPATFADGLACQRVMDAVRMSAKSGAWVPVA